MSSMSPDKVDASLRMKGLMESHRRLVRLRVTSETARAAKEWLDEAARFRTQFPEWAPRIAALESRMLDAYPDL
jgi:hypothetical protein